MHGEDIGTLEVEAILASVRLVVERTGMLAGLNQTHQMQSSILMTKGLFEKLRQSF